MTTKQQWIESCADRYLAVSDLGPDTALYFAEACAEQQVAINGETIAEWDLPSDAADEDMSYWSDDE